MNRRVLWSCGFLFVALWGVRSRAAAPIHQYTFNDGTANDAIGNADGTLMGTAFVGGLGTLITTGGGNGNSYLDLPDGIASAASSGGVSGQITAEAWVNVNANANWAVIFSFGNSGPDAEDGDGGDGDYWQLIPQNGAGPPNALRTTTHAAAGAEIFADDTVNASPLPAGSLQHVVNVLNVGADTNELYLNGELVGSSAIQPGFDPNTFGSVGDTQNWLGRSQWADPSFDGSYDEFRIYDHALSAQEVQENFDEGPVPPPAVPLTPTLTIDRDNGSIVLQGGQTASQVVGYTIQSAFGALEQSGWTTISGNKDNSTTGDGSFDGNGEWTVLTTADSHTDLSEFEFDGGDGGELGIGEFLNLSTGAAWLQSPTEDLVMNLKLDDGTTLPVTIVYTGNGGEPFVRSDLNFSGDVDEQDWPIFRDNSFTDLSTLSLAEAYARADLDGDLDADYDDFLLFQADFDAANGVGALSALVNGPSVPEPGSAVLVIGLLSMYWAAARRSLPLIASTASQSSSEICSMRYDSFPLALRMLAAIAVAGFIAAQSQAAVPVHQYTFNDGTASDSVGSADGILMGTATTSLVGRLNLTGGGDGNSYLELPTGIASTASAGGISGEITTEAWVEVNANSNWAVIFSFGNSGPEADRDGSNGDYWQLIPQNGAGTPNALRTTTHASAGAETFADDTVNASPLPTSTLQHVVNVLDVGADTNELYLNGVLVGSSAIQPGFDPNTYGTVGDTQNWLGRSQWADPSFDGSYDEFRIYDHALSAQEVQDNFDEGPVPSDLLTLVVDPHDGDAIIRNDAAISLGFGFYEIRSNGGALDGNGWNSLDDQVFDPQDGADPDTIAGNGEGETWDEAAGLTDEFLAEFFLQGESMLAPGESVSLGQPFDTSVFGEGNIGDLSFSFAPRQEALVPSSVKYEEINVVAVAGDYNGDGTVNSADYAIWAATLGSTTDLRADGDGNNVVDIADYAFWKVRIGNTAGSGSGDAMSSVPEPSSLALLVVVGLLAAAHKRRCRFFRGVLVVLLGIGVTATGIASTTNDRIYSFGESDLGTPTVGDIVGNGLLAPDPTTLDSAGTSGTGNIQPLFAQAAAPGGNDPRYVAPANAALPGSSLAAEFDGDDYLFGRRLGLPETSDPAVDIPAEGDDTDGLAPEDYSGIANRGFQLWVKPGATGTLQSVVLDTNQHGLQITSGGTWSMRYAGTDFDSGVSVAVGQWDHVMVVRPEGAANGAQLYVNGSVVAAAGGGYDGTDNARLVVGANTSDDNAMLGMSEFFTGVVDELEMFVMGTNNGEPATDFGTFDPAEDNAAIAAALSGKPQGDLNLDGSVNSTDINTFVENWLTNPKAVNGITVADLDTYKLGDLDFSGFIDIDDAFLLHEGIQLAGGAGLNFGLLRGEGVPEPSSVSLLLAGLVTAVAKQPRRRHRTSTELFMEISHSKANNIKSSRSEL